MAKQKHIEFRRKVLNRCLRNEEGYTFQQLLEIVNDRLSIEFGPDVQIAERTLHNELRELENQIEFVEGYYRGHERMYRYANKYNSYESPFTDEELETIDGAIEVLRETADGDKPQYAYVRTYLELIKTERADTGNVSFQSNIDLRGLEHFETLMSATIHHRTLNITYQPYGKREQKRSISPYQLRQYNDRWFLIGSDKGYETISVFAIDRILSVETARFKFRESAVDIDEYFDDVVGVTVPNDSEVEKVLLKVSNQRYPYVETKPIHWSQKMIHEKSTKTHTVIQLNVKLNKELSSKILAFGDDIEVLEPKSLRKELKETINRMTKKYS